jgi:hypothetical protein
LSGLNAKALLGSATGTLRVEAAKGALPHIELTEGAGPLAIEHLTAQLSLHDGKFEIQDGKLNTTHEVFQLSGTASMAQVLNLKLTRPGASGFSVTGPLAGPHVFSFAAPETRAALKQ